MNAPERAINDTPREAIRRRFLEAGLPADLADGYADLVCREFTGSMVYFAAREWVDKSTRDDRIRAERGAGRSWQWLSREFCLSRTQVRRICESDG